LIKITVVYDNNPYYEGIEMERDDVKKMKLMEEESGRFWEEHADSFSEYTRSGRDVYREYFNNPAFFSFVDDVKGKRILDAGCGEGSNTRWFAGQGAQMVGVDISKRFIDLATKEEIERPKGIEYIATSLSDLSCLDENSFDLVASTMVFMDVPNYEQAFKEIFKVLKPGGSLFFSILHPCFKTAGYNWNEYDLNLGKLTISHYFTKEPAFSGIDAGDKIPGSANKPFKSIIYKRTMSDYINTLIKMGFVIGKIQEPRPFKEACERFPVFQKWRDHAAKFLYVCAIKPVKV
jgi:2-polyprenyl-3-methyl-5-hydroxy-6-metoxy-1,4-benzoquinol methylase